MAGMDLSKLSDEELAERAKTRTARGEIPEGAWEAYYAIYERYNNRIFWFVLYCVGEDNYAAAVDVTDRAFTKAMDALPRRKRADSFSAWLHTIAKHEAWKWYKRQIISLQRYMDEQEARGRSPEDSIWKAIGSGQVEQPESIELRELIEQAKAMLSRRECQVFTLRYEEGLEVEEIASQLDAKVPTIRQALWRATERFKSAFRDPDDFAIPKKGRTGDSSPRPKRSHKTPGSPKVDRKKGGSET